MSAAAPAGPVLVTGSSGHLGEALARTLKDMGVPCVGMDCVGGPFTTIQMTLGADAKAVHDLFSEHRFATVYHAATLHKPHIATHSKQQFIDTNVAGTLHLLEASQSVGCVAEFVFTSSTTVFGHAIPRDAAPCCRELPAWMDEKVVPIPRNIYGLTKVSAEHLVELFAREQHKRGAPSAAATRFTILRTSRFFLEHDDDPKRREMMSEVNLKVAELLYRRVDLADLAQAHVLAATKPRPPATVGPQCDTYIISAPPPFSQDELRRAWEVGDGGERMRGLLESVADDPDALSSALDRTNWTLPDAMFDRIYDSRKACRELGWAPAFTFTNALAKAQQRMAAKAGDVAYTDLCSDLHTAVGSKVYHTTDVRNGDQPFPTQ